LQITDIQLFNEEINWSLLEVNPDTNFVLANGQVIYDIRFDSTAKWNLCPENLSLMYKNNYITFNFIGITQASPKKVKYQFILEGNDNSWSIPTLHTEAHYSNLSPGRYTFKVKAMSGDGYWGNEVQYPFVIRPPWWLTWQAYVGYALLFLSLIYSAFRIQKQRTIKNEQLKAQQKQAILNERLRISRELHDEVGATLSGISMYSHIAKEQNKSQDRQVVDNSLTIMQESAGEMVNKLNDIVWLLNPEQASLQKLMEKLEDYTRQMAQAKNIHVSTTLPSTISAIELPVEDRKNIYLILKEAINNSVKYSRATALDLHIRDFDHTLEFLLKDNGTGFNFESVRKGNGLENMRSRAADIGAALSIDSTDQGTVVRLQCKIPQ
jgi:signal transduction histidine kinase